MSKLPNSNSDTGDDTGVGRTRIDPKHTTLGEGVWDHRPRPGPAVCHHEFTGVGGSTALVATYRPVTLVATSPPIEHRVQQPMTMTPGLRKFALTAHSRSRSAGSARSLPTWRSSSPP